MIELLAIDVDGTLTDGQIIYHEGGGEIRGFDVKDGMGMVAWMRLGGSIALITGRSSAMTERRAKELGVTHLFQGVSNKKEVLSQLLDQVGVAPQSCAAIGDDLNDLPMFAVAGLTFCPSDAHAQVQKQAQIVLKAPGGRGAVREMIDRILEQEGRGEAMRALWV